MASGNGVHPDIERAAMPPARLTDDSPNTAPQGIRSWPYHQTSRKHRREHGLLGHIRQHMDVDRSAEPVGSAGRRQTAVWISAPVISRTTCSIFVSAVRTTPARLPALRTRIRFVSWKT